VKKLLNLIKKLKIGKTFTGNLRGQKNHLQLSNPPKSQLKKKEDISPLFLCLLFLDIS
jgi:hypothetical protein